MIYANGDTYVGDWKNDKKEGMGEANFITDGLSIGALIVVPGIYCFKFFNHWHYD